MLNSQTLSFKKALILNFLENKYNSSVIMLNSAFFAYAVILNQKPLELFFSKSYFFFPLAVDKGKV